MDGILIQNKDLVNYIFLIASCYLVYEGTRDLIPSKLKRYILDRSFFVLIATFLGGFFVHDGNLKQALFTFSSVYLGFWLSNEQKKRDEIKTLKYYLGLIWDEQRFNLHQYEVIARNFTFLFDNPTRISLNAFRMGTIYSLSGSLKSKAHESYLSSGAITTLSSVQRPIKEKDEIFNSVEIAYSNVDHFKSFLLTVSTDFQNKALISNDIIGGPFAQGASDDMEAKVTDTAKELMIAKRSALNARDLLDQFLEKLNIKLDTEELRKDTLTEEDKEFINKVIRRDPIQPNEIFRRPEETDF